MRKDRSPDRQRRTPGRTFLAVPFYPLILACLPVLQTYEVNFNLLYARDLWRPIVLYEVVTVFLWFGMRSVFGSWGRAGPVTAALVYLFFMSGRAQIAWVATVVALTLLLMVGLLRKNLEEQPVSAALNVALLAFALFSVYNIVQSERAMYTPAFRQGHDRAFSWVRTPPASELPDIYFVVIDGLGRNDVLERLYAVPADSLCKPLEDLGFRVLRQSHANYPQTTLSLTATLNAMFIQELFEQPAAWTVDRRPLGKLIAKSRVSRALRQLGYQVITYPSGYNMSHFAEADERKKPRLALELLDVILLGKSAVRPLELLLGRGPSGIAHEMHRRRLEYTLSKLPSAREGVDASRPVFVFAHLLAPHPPFVFDRHGEPVRSDVEYSLNEGTHWQTLHKNDGMSYIDGYREQAEYMLQRLTNVAQQVLDSATRPIAIIIQADHGPGSRLDWERQEETDLEERFGIFNAWYLPAGAADQLSDSLSAVNTFPVLFNKLFGSEFKVRPDLAFFAQWSQPFEFFPVTLGHPATPDKRAAP